MHIMLMLQRAPSAFNWIGRKTRRLLQALVGPNRDTEERVTALAQRVEQLSLRFEQITANLDKLESVLSTFDRNPYSGRPPEASRFGPGVPATFDRLVARTAGNATRLVIFLHVPKAAGNSAYGLFVQNGYHFLPLGSASNTFFELIPEDKWRTDQELRPYILGGHLRLSHSIFKTLGLPYVALTILRDPISRMLSNYNFTLRVRAAPGHDEVISGRMSFIEYAEMMHRQLGPQFKFFDKTGDGTITPNGTGSAQQCLDNLSELGFYGFTDRISEFATVAGYLLGMKNILFVRQINVTNALINDSAPPPKAALTDDELKHLTTLLRDDIWFYHEAIKLYKTRISHPAIQSILHDTEPLHIEAETLIRRLEEIRDPQRDSPAFSKPSWAEEWRF